MRRSGSGSSASPAPPRRWITRNIIPIFDAGEAGGVLFIAMRYVAGQDVHSLLHRAGPLPAPRAIGIITQVAAALDAAHACGLVHRDVKPANMLLGGLAEHSTGDHVYLSDFGISKAVHATSSLTLTGQVLGTLNYLAPEQVEGRTVDGRADGYALACAAFEMLAGSPPFRRDENLAVMWAQVSAPPPPLTQYRPDLPPAVDRVMARALAKSPADRYQACLAFAAALQEACRTAEAGTPNGTVPAGPGRRGAPPTMADVPAPAARPPSRLPRPPARGSRGRGRRPGRPRRARPPARGPARRGGRAPGPLPGRAGGHARVPGPRGRRRGPPPRPRPARPPVGRPRRPSRGRPHLLPAPAGPSRRPRRTAAARPPPAGGDQPAPCPAAAAAARHRGLVIFLVCVLAA